MKGNGLNQRTNHTFEMWNGSFETRRTSSSRPISTLFPMPPQIYSPQRWDNLFSIFHASSHMPTQFTLAPKDRNEFDTVKFIWERKDAYIAIKRDDTAQKWFKRNMDSSTSFRGANKENMMILRYVAPIDDMVF